jgi:hypothetical protein
MSGYLAQLQSEAHAADLAEQARSARRIRTSPRRPSRLRHSLAVLLVALATRLDHALQVPAPAPTSGPGR